MRKLAKGEIIKRLEKLRDSTDAKSRVEAQRELIESELETLIETLVEIIKSEKDTEILAYAAEILVKSNEEKKAERILPLIHSTDSTLRIHICGLLGNCGDEIALEYLMEKLESDVNANVRITAAWALGKIGSRKALEALA